MRNAIPPRRFVAAAALALASCSQTTVKSQPSLLTASTDLLDFGDVVVGAQSQRTVFFLDKGSRPITLGDPHGDGLGGVFSVLLETVSVDPAGDAVARVVFSPTSVKPFTTTFVFPNDSQNESQFTLTIKGNGIQGDPCKGVTCDAPPKAVCLDAQKSRNYDPAGTCTDGRCNYAPLDADCPHGCDAATGFCAGDPCVGVACVVPPKLTCISGTVSRGFNPNGTCGNGQCTYSPIDATCPYGCDQTTGACKTDPCQGVTCVTPPNGCFSAVGTCVNGGCSYAPTDGAPCDDSDACTTNDTCNQGNCHGTRTTCGTPPADACGDQVTLWKYTAAGVCGGSGACSYTYTAVHCDYGCENGACKGDPCAGGCDDGNPCTADSCVPGVGCVHDAQTNNGYACNSGSGDCPNGTCNSGLCRVDQGQTCVAEVPTDLCGSVKVPGNCTANGTCAVQQTPPDQQCPPSACASNHLCIDIKCSPTPGITFDWPICL